MFDWIKDNIINSPAQIMGFDVAGNEIAEEVTALTASKKLLVKRAGEYFGSKMSKVAKTEGHVAAPSTLTIDCANIMTCGLAADEPHSFVATIKVEMFNKFLGEYANANWALFGRPILVGFDVPAGLTAAKFADALEEALRLSIAENNRFMSISRAGDVITCTLDGPWTYGYATFASFAVESYDPTACDSCLGEYHALPMEGDIVKGVEPFATGEWIRENLRFPSYPNLRYTPLYADEQPIPGALYTQYSFQYTVNEKGHGGLGFVGQDIVSTTTHVFYVINSAVAAFEKALEIADVEVVPHVVGGAAADHTESHTSVVVDNEVIAKP